MLAHACALRKQRWFACVARRCCSGDTVLLVARMRSACSFELVHVVALAFSCTFETSTESGVKASRKWRAAGKKRNTGQSICEWRQASFGGAVE